MKTIPQALPSPKFITNAELFCVYGYNSDCRFSMRITTKKLTSLINVSLGYPEENQITSRELTKRFDWLKAVRFFKEIQTKILLKCENSWIL